MTKEIDKKLLNKIISKYSPDNQIEMVIEECSELILALQKLKRYGGADRRTDVISEIADVKIMMAQCDILFEEDKINEQVEFKLNRLRGKLN